MRSVMALGGWSQWEELVAVCALCWDWYSSKRGEVRSRAEHGVVVRGTNLGEMEQCGLVVVLWLSCRCLLLCAGMMVSCRPYQNQDLIRGQVVAEMLVWLVAKGRTRPWPSTDYSGQCCIIGQYAEPASRMFAATASFPSGA